MNAQFRSFTTVLCVTTLIGCGDAPLTVETPSALGLHNPIARLAGDNGDVVLSGIGTATIDGRITPGEWDRAGVADFTLSNFLESHPSRMYVMNDESYLYIA